MNIESVSFLESIYRSNQADWFNNQIGMLLEKSKPRLAGIKNTPFKGHFLFHDFKQTLLVLLLYLYAPS